MITIKLNTRLQVDNNKFDKWIKKRGIGRAVGRTIIKEKFSDLCDNWLKQEGLKWIAINVKKYLKKMNILGTMRKQKSIFAINVQRRTMENIFDILYISDSIFRIIMMIFVIKVCIKYIKEIK